MKRKKKWYNFLYYSILPVALGVLLNGCGIYSFTGTNINPNVKTVSVEAFPNLASIIAPELSQNLAEKLKDRCTSETRLKIIASGGDISFSGAILNYYVEPAAASANDEAALNRLLVSVRAEYTNSITDKTWTQNVQHFANFDRNANLSDVENVLIDEIVEKVVDDIFNKAFANW